MQCISAVSGQGWPVLARRAQCSPATRRAAGSPATASAVRERMVPGAVLDSGVCRHAVWADAVAVHRVHRHGT